MVGVKKRVRRRRAACAHASPKPSLLSVIAKMSVITRNRKGNLYLLAFGYGVFHKSRTLAGQVD